MQKIKHDKIIFKTETTSMDANGDISTFQKTSHTLVESEPNYIKLYINTILTFNELSTTLSPLMLELLKRMTFANPAEPNGGQMIVISAYVREQICETLDIKLNTLSKSIKQLCMNGVLKRLGTGAYQVNPYFFGLGDWKDIKKIRATFDFNTRKVIAEFTKESK